MASFTYTRDLPVATNSPSVDQPNMTINNQSNNDIWLTDHVGFNASNGGSHLQQSYAATTSFTSLPSGIAGVAYPGVDTQSKMNMYFVNDTNFIAGVAYPLPMSMIKAGGVLVANPAGPSLSYSFNCVSVAYVAPGMYNVTLRPGLVQGSNVLVSLSFTGSSTLSSSRWTYAANVLTIYGSPTATASFSFVVMQF